MSKLNNLLVVNLFDDNVNDLFLAEITGDKSSTEIKKEIDKLKDDFEAMENEAEAIEKIHNGNYDEAGESAEIDYPLEAYELPENQKIEVQDE